MLNSSYSSFYAPHRVYSLFKIFQEMTKICPFELQPIWNKAFLTARTDLAGSHGCIVKDGLQRCAVRMRWRPLKMIQWRDGWIGPTLQECSLNKVRNFLNASSVALSFKLLNSLRISEMKICQERVKQTWERRKEKQESILVPWINPPLEMRQYNIWSKKYFQRNLRRHFLTIGQNPCSISKKSPAKDEVMHMIGLMTES